MSLINNSDSLIPKKDDNKKDITDLTLPELEKLIAEQHERTMGNFESMLISLARLDRMTAKLAAWAKGLQPTRKATLTVTKLELTIEEGGALNG